MLVRIGHDLQSLSEAARKSHVFSSRAIFSDYERKYTNSKVDRLQTAVGLLCAKEAVIKAISGLGEPPCFSFKDIIIRHERDGRPKVEFRSSIQQYLLGKNAHCDISISHTTGYASAVAIILSGV